MFGKLPNISEGIYEAILGRDAKEWDQMTSREKQMENVTSEFVELEGKENERGGLASLVLGLAGWIKGEKYGEWEEIYPVVKGLLLLLKAVDQALWAKEMEEGKL